MLLAVILLAITSQVETRDPDDGVPVGIDLGTTYMSVGAFNNGRIEIIPNEQGRRVTPSCVAFTAEGERLIGDAAKAQASSNPQNTVFNVKRLIGRTWDDPALQEDIKYLPYMVVNKNGKILIQVDIGGRPHEFTPEEISAMLLAYMKQIAEVYLGQEVTSAVITVPAYFNDAQRQATKDAGKMAGLNILRVMNEPTAAVLGYDINRKSTDDLSNILVYDLGGGTIDVSIVSSGYGTIRVLSTKGDTHLGGEDFDQRIIEHLIKIIKKKTGHGIKKNSRVLQKLRREAERAKRTLSSKHVASIEVEDVVMGVDLSEKLSRATFEKLNIDLFQSTLTCVQRALDACGLEKYQDINDILFVGGSTLIPKIRESVLDYFWWQPTPIRGVNPIEAVAYGAALQASMLKQDIQYNRVVLDILPISLGIEEGKGVMLFMMKNGTIIPSDKGKSFTTARDNQESVRVKIFEGEEKLTKDNRLLGTFDLDGIFPAPAGFPEVKVTFEVDVHGILKVSAINRDAGIKESITIKKDNTRLSKREIEKKAGEIKAFVEQDRAVHKQVDTRNDFEAYIYGMINHVNGIGSELKETDRIFMKKALDEKLVWLEESKDIEVSEVEHHKKILGAILRARITHKGHHSRQDL